MAQKPIPKEKQDRIFELIGQGMPAWEVAKTLDLATSTIYMHLNPERRKMQKAAQQAWRRRNRGICIDCGGRTGTIAKQGRKRCQACDTKHMLQRTKGKGPVQQRIAELITGKEMRLKDIAAAINRDRSHTRFMLKQMIDVGIARKVRKGVYTVDRDLGPSDEDEANA